MLLLRNLVSIYSSYGIIYQKSVFAVGMIRCDGEGRLNEKSVTLQSRYFDVHFLFVISYKLWRLRWKEPEDASNINI